MTAELPEPPVPQNLDLRDFEYIPLGAQRLRDSTLARKSTGDEFRAAVLLWCSAWHQVPAGSLPNDDVELAYFAGYGRDVTSWSVVKNVALHGFVLCRDGRLYHRVVVERALQAHAAKLKNAERTQAATTARSRKRAQADPELNLGCGVERDVDQYKGREGKGFSESPSGTTRARPRRTAGTTLPEDWSPDEALVTYGIDLGFTRAQVMAAAEDMRLWARGNANRAVARKADWRATFQGWLRRNFRGPGGGSPVNGSPRPNGPNKPGGRSMYAIAAGVMDGKDERTH